MGSVCTYWQVVKLGTGRERTAGNHTIELHSAVENSRRKVTTGMGDGDGYGEEVGNGVARAQKLLYSLVFGEGERWIERAGPVGV